MMIVLKRMHDPFNVNKRCSLKQIAEALVLSTLDYEWNHYLVDHSKPGYFKSLDTFMATVYHFTQVFDWKFRKIIDKYLESKNWVSEEEFLNILAPRCEILSQKKDHIGLILTCSFATEALRIFRIFFKCLHYDTPTCNYLLGFLEKSFKCLENKTYWNSLMHYCKETNKAICNRRFKTKYLPVKKPASPVSSGDDVENGTDESDIKFKSETIKTGGNYKLEWPDMNNEKFKNLSVQFNGKTDTRDDQSIKSTQSEVISNFLQDAIEKNKIQEINRSYCGSNIAVNKSSVSNREVIGIQTNDERRKRKMDTIENGTINKLGCPDTGTKEKTNIISEHFNDTEKICDETFTTTSSKIISDASQNGEIERKNSQEKEYIGTENSVSSSPIQEMESWYNTTSSEDSTDEHASDRHGYYTLFTPNRPYKLEMLGLLKKCEADFNTSFQNKFNDDQSEKNISSSSTAKREESEKGFESKKNADDELVDNREKVQTPLNDHKPNNTNGTRKKGSKRCKDCKGKNFQLHFREWKRAFKNSYKNVNVVSDCFYENV